MKLFLDRRRIHISLFWWLMTAMLGVTLRLTAVDLLALNYQNVLHAHSHIAFLGWVFTGIFALVAMKFVPVNHPLQRKLTLQFYMLQCVNLGMVVSFLLQGYAMFSIIFSALQMSLSIWFVISVYLINRRPGFAMLSPSVKFLFAAFLFLLISCLGPLSLPIIAKSVGRDSIRYQNAVYFYLHFQYNGWFIFSLIAFLLKKLEDMNRNIPKRPAEFLFKLLFVSVILTLPLSLKGSDLHTGISGFVGLLGALIQVIVLILAISVHQKIQTDKMKNVSRILFVVSSLAIALKIAFQLLSAFPYFSDLIQSNRHLIIGYLHLVLIGVVSMSLLNYFILEKLIDILKKPVRLGVLILLCSFLLSDVLTFGEGFLNLRGETLPRYLYFQMVLSIVMLSGLAMIFFGSFSVKLTRAKLFASLAR